MANEKWISEQRVRIAELIRGANLERHLEDILSTLRPSIRLFPEPPTAASKQLDGSRFGGNAALESPDAWPEYKGAPLTFLCQLNLADTAEYDVEKALPSTGLLSFFKYNTFDEGEDDDEDDDDDDEDDDEVADAYGEVCAVLYHEDTTQLVAVKPPYGKDERVTLQAMRFEPELCLPPLEGSDFDRIDLGQDFDTYWDAVWMNRNALPDEPFFRLLGHPDMNYAHHMKGSRLLLQFCSESEIGWEFGDYQDLRFLIEPEALAAADFGQASCNGEEE